MTISDQSSKTIVLRFFCCGLSGASLPSCFSEVVRVREAKLNVLENMSSKEPMYSAEQALEKIWNDSGDEGDLTAMKVNLRCIRRAKMKVTSLVLMPLHQGKIVLNTRRRVVMMKLKVAEMVRQRPARRQEAPLLWRMARGTTPRVIPFTGNSGVQVLTEGF